MKSLLLVIAAIIVTACSNNRPSFVNMSEIELAAHNRGLHAEEQVFCVREADSSSYIRKRICNSYNGWIEHNQRAAMTLDVLNSRPNYSLPNSIQDGPARD
jgi:hypothetical protein